MLDRLDEEAAGLEPSGGAPVDGRDLVRLGGGELEAGVLGEQRVHAVPAAVLEPGDEQVRALELGQDLPRSPTGPRTWSASSAVNRRSTAARRRNARASASSAPIASALR